MNNYSQPQKAQQYQPQIVGYSGQQQLPPPPPGAPVAWMQRPQPIPGVPIGLEYLSQIDGLHVQQKVSLLEAFVGWETNNKYAVSNSAGQQVFYAMEDTDACMRICCGAQRRFTINVVDNLNQVVIVFKREFKYCAGCCWCSGCCDCCSHEVTVESPPGTIIGFVKQKGSFWKASYDILNENHDPILKIQGPCCVCDGVFACCCENEFKVLSIDGQTQVGKINKKYAGILREAFTVADSFSVSFPVDLAVKAKATLLGALFLIDFMFFEKKEDN